MKITPLIFLLFHLHFVASGQGAVADSIKQVLPTLSEKDQFECIMRHIDDVSGKNFDRGKQLVRKAMELAIDNRWKKRELKAKKKLARIEYLSGDYEQSSILDHEIVDYYEANNDQGSAGDQLNFMALSQSHLENYDQALNYLDLALADCTQAKDSLCMGVNYDHRGVVYMRIKKPQSALASFLTCLQIRKTIKDTLGLGYIYDNLSWAYTDLQQYDEALVMVEKAMEIRVLLGIEADIAVNINNIGEVYFAKTDYVSAIKYFEQSLNKSIGIGFNDLSRHTYDYISRAYSKLENFEKANSYLKRSYALKDSLMSAEKTKALLELETRYETERKEKTIQLQQLEIEKAETQARLFTYGSIAVILTLSLLAALAYFYNKNKQEAIQKQIELDNQQRLIEASMEAAEEERKRISRDLHDGVGQQLSGLKMGWQRLSNNMNAETPLQSEAINKLTTILDVATNDVRTISHQLMPKSLSEFGLVPTIEDMLEKSFAPSGIQYEFDDFGITNRFDEKIEIAVFRISQELVNNVLKHSEARKVEVQLYKTDGNLILSVADDGKGLPEDLTKIKGHGLMNMRSRAKAISAKFHFEKNSDSGLAAVLRIPI